MVKKKITKEDIELLKLFSTDLVYKKRTITITTTGKDNISTTTTKTIETVIKLPVIPQ